MLLMGQLVWMRCATPLGAVLAPRASEAIWQRRSERDPNAAHCSLGRRHCAMRIAPAPSNRALQPCLVHYCSVRGREAVKPGGGSTIFDNVLQFLREPELALSKVSLVRG